MTATTTFVSSKGGVGTTTVAVLHALELARSGHVVRLTANDAASGEDLAAVLGVPAPGPRDTVEVLPQLTLADHPSPEGHTIVDAGTDTFSDHPGPVYVVLRNDYLSLRRALNVPRTTVGLILLNEPARALGRRDVEEVLAHPIAAELAVDPAVARAIDAGVLSTRSRRRLCLAPTPGVSC